MAMMNGDDNKDYWDALETLKNYDNVVNGKCREMLMPIDLKTWCLYLTKFLDDDDNTATGHYDYGQDNDDHKDLASISDQAFSLCRLTN